MLKFCNGIHTGGSSKNEVISLMKNSHPIYIYLHWITRLLIIDFPEITGYIKVFNGDNYLKITNNEKMLVRKHVGKYSTLY